MSDLEKFGIKAGHIEELYADNSQGKPQKAVNTVKEKEQEKEEDFLFDKIVLFVLVVNFYKSKNDRNGQRSKTKI